jgi:SPP1 family predicted phage head-tail adaptor
MPRTTSTSLDRKIVIQRSMTTNSDSGEPIETWTDVATRRAEILPVRGDERFGGDQWVAKEQVEFRVRWSIDVANVSPLDRVIYPVGSSTDANTYDVMAVHEMGRHVGLRIMAARRSDVPA